MAKREAETSLLEKLYSSTVQCMFGIKGLEFRRTKISELAFPEGVCPNLQKLTVIQCQDLRHIGELCGVAKLVRLDIIGCAQVEELPSLETLRSLERLDVTECKMLRTIQGLQQLTNLRMLFVSGCHEIVGLPGVEHYSSLEYLNASECAKLKGVLRLGLRLTKLQSLFVSGCHEIVGFIVYGIYYFFEFFHFSFCSFTIKSFRVFGESHCYKCAKLGWRYIVSVAYLSIAYIGNNINVNCCLQLLRIFLNLTYSLSI